MSIHVAVSSLETVVSPEGDLDQTNAEDVFQALCRADTLSVVLDLGAVSFLDSSMLGACVRATTHLESAGRRLRIVNPAEKIRRVFEITGLVAMLEDSP
jgi:anti-anti-sigma factor